MMKSPTENGITAIVGLGNQGAEYALNRHNIGFMFVDVLAEIYRAPLFKRHGQNLLTSITINDRKILLIKPQAFMNLSGHALSPLIQFFKFSLSEIIVVHDDLDLEFNKLRIKQGGGHGGHNGLKNLDGTVGNGYWRLRFGIGHPGYKDAVSGYVLSNFSKSEQEYLPNTLSYMADALPYLIHLDTNKFLQCVGAGQ